MSKTILITGAGAGLGEGAALGLARKGHRVITTAQVAPQVTALRRKVEALGLTNIEVEKLDLHDPYDVAQALRCEIDVLLNNAAIGEGGPVSEIPIELVRRSFETNLLAPLALSQGFAANWVKAGTRGKIVFASSIWGLVTPAGFGAYAATTHALEAVAASLHHELAPFGIRIQVINAGPYPTGFNEAMADTPFRWLDDAKNFTSRAAMREILDSLPGSDECGLDPAELIAQTIEIVAADGGKFRNIVPLFMEDALKEAQAEAWDRSA